MMVSLIDEAVAAGARQRGACEVLGISERTLQRYRRQPQFGTDQRQGSHGEPANKLSPEERREILETANDVEFWDLSPHQIVPALADRGAYLGSESSFYRVLREHGMVHHREPTRAPQPGHRRRGYTATGIDQIWTWDITCLAAQVRGMFFYLYLFVDIFSRKIVGWAVHEEESMLLASELLEEVVLREGLEVDSGLVVHSDNGGPMRGSTMLATMQWLGIEASFSRPSVSDDNPFSEALFRTLKCRPQYPRRFETLAQANEWVAGFVEWYNHVHLHSAIGYVTPASRHAGEDAGILAARRLVYEAARKAHPERWSGDVRDCEPVVRVELNGGQKRQNPRRQLSLDWTGRKQNALDASAQISEPPPLVPSPVTHKAAADELENSVQGAVDASSETPPGCSRKFDHCGRARGENSSPNRRLDGNDSPDLRTGSITELTRQLS